MSRMNGNSNGDAESIAVTHRSSWKFNPRNLALSFGRPHQRYYVNLEECDTSTGMLDCIMQVSGKRWADDHVLASLVRDLNHLLNPQGNQRGPINVRKVIRQRLAT